MTDAYCRKDMNLKHPVGQCPYDDAPEASVTDVMEEGCERCGHSHGAHVILALETGTVAGTEIPVGGVMLCPECDCAATWAADGYPHMAMPPENVVRHLRATVIR